MTKLKREVGLWGAASVGIANIIGAGIFVVSGIAAGLAGPSVILSFLIAGFVAMLTALSTAELSSFINETGASYAFTKRAFGLPWSFFVGWFKYFDYIAGAAAVSVGFAAYLTGLLNLTGDLPLIAAAVGLPLVFTVINILGSKESTSITTVMVAIKVFALTLLLLICGYYLLENFSSAKLTPFFPNGLNGTFNGAAIIFFAFLGFNTVAMMSEETKDPAHTIPKALILAFVVTFILYVGVGFAEVSILDWRVLGLTASPISELASAVSNYAPFLDLISISALIATSSVVLSSLIGGSRASFAMGRDRLLPSFFDRVSQKTGTPYVSILVGGGIIMGLAGLFYNRIDTIASIVNFGSLFTYLFVHLSVLKLRKSEKSEGLFKVPFYPFFPILGALSCVLMMYYLDLNAKIASVIWFVLGLIVYFIMGRYKKSG